MVQEVEPGDYRDIDSYLAELREAGYEAYYKNLWSGTSGFTARLSIDGDTHAVFEGTDFGHLVKDVPNKLEGF